jgi:hypothetical protein
MRRIWFNGEERLGFIASDDGSAGLFALPAAIVAVGVTLAEVSAYLDRTINPGATTGWGVQMNSNGATWLLSTVAGATITTAGVVFSLTVVSLQLASSQFSPRSGIARTVRSKVSRPTVIPSRVARREPARPAIARPIVSTTASSIVVRRAYHLLTVSE